MHCVKCETKDDVDGPERESICPTCYSKKVEEVRSLFDMCELAWGLVANAYGGDWSTASKMWREAAERWRDLYHGKAGLLINNGVNVEGKVDETDSHR